MAVHWLDNSENISIRIIGTAYFSLDPQTTPSSMEWVNSVWRVPVLLDRLSLFRSLSSSTASPSVGSSVGLHSHRGIVGDPCKSVKRLGGGLKQMHPTFVYSRVTHIRNDLFLSFTHACLWLCVFVQADTHTTAEVTHWIGAFFSYQTLTTP